MNINKIIKILNEMGTDKNYSDYINLLTFEERKYILYNNERFSDCTVFNDDDFLNYFFSMEEADSLYDDIINVDDSIKTVIGLNSSEENKRKIYEILNENYNKLLVANSFQSDDDKINAINDFTDYYSHTELLSKISNLDYKLNYIRENIGNEDYNFSSFFINVKNDEEIIKYLDLLNSLSNDFISYNGYKSTLIKNFSTDELKNKYLDFIDDIEYKSQIIETFDNDVAKIDFLKSNPFESLTDSSKAINKHHMLLSIKDDKLKYDNLNLVAKYLRGHIVKTIKSDDLKLRYLKSQNFTGQSDIVASLSDENLKVKFLENVIFTDFEKKNIIESIENVEQRFELYEKHLENVSFEHLEYLAQIKGKYPKLIEKVSIINNVNKEHLNILIDKYGYIILKYLNNENIKDMLNLNDEYFKKYINIFDTQLAKTLTMRDVDNITEAIIQREFRINNRSTMSVFSGFEIFINNKDKEKIFVTLNSISKKINIEDILNKYNMNSDTLINNLLNGNSIEILHMITDKYIETIRNEYLLKRQNEVKNEINFDIAYEKNDLINLFINVEKFENIYKLLHKIDNLTIEENNFINDKELLQACLLFKKNPTNYKGIEVKNKIKTLNQLLTKLYLDKKLNYVRKYDSNIKTICNIKNVNNEILFKIMQEIDVNKLVETTLSNEELYNKLTKVINMYHFIGWSDMFEKLLTSSDLIFNESEISSLINYFYNFYPKLEERQRLGNIKNISLITLIDECSLYSSTSSKYKYLLNSEDYHLIITNPSPNASTMKKNERIESLPELVKKCYKRKYITIPPTNENIILKNNKKINVSVGNVTNSINLTYGERTGACMRIGGAGRTLFEFCLENNNGFHIKFEEPNTHKLISRVSGFRNGNTIFLNQLRNSLDEKYSASDLIEALKNFSNIIIGKTKNSEFPIENVVISDGFSMEKYSKEKSVLGVDPKEGFDYFYSDVDGNNAIFLTEQKEVKIGVNNVVNYDVVRDNIRHYNNIDDIKENLQRLKLIDGLLKNKTIDEIELLPDEVFSDIKELYCGEDWYIALDSSCNIVSQYNIINSNEAIKEMDIIMNNLSQKRGKLI